MVWRHIPACVVPVLLIGCMETNSFRPPPTTVRTSQPRAGEARGTEPRIGEPRPSETRANEPRAVEPLKTEVAQRPKPAPPLYIPGPPSPEPVAPSNGNDAFARPVSHQEPVQVIPIAVQTPQPEKKVQAASPLRDMAERALKKNATLNGYIMRLRRREVVGGQPRAEELMECKFRKEPWSVYFKWLGPEAQGREVVYSKGRYDNVIHTLTAAGDILFVPAGKHIKVAPDSVLVKSKTRYPITDAGLSPLIERFARLVGANERGDTREGTLQYIGLVDRKEFPNKVEVARQTVPPRADPTLPRGGQRHWFFDPTLNLPVLIITQDDTGREVEYYCHDRIMFVDRLDEDDFNPERLWKQPAN